MKKALSLILVVLTMCAITVTPAFAEITLTEALESSQTSYSITKTGSNRYKVNYKGRRYKLNGTDDWSDTHYYLYWVPSNSTDGQYYRDKMPSGSEYIKLLSGQESTSRWWYCYVDIPNKDIRYGKKLAIVYELEYDNGPNDGQGPRTSYTIEKVYDFPDTDNPSLEVTLEDDLWHTASAGVNVNVDASDATSGVKSIEYRIN